MNKIGTEARFSHLTPRYEKTFNVIFMAADGTRLSTICKWLKNSHDVNHYIALDNGNVIGCNENGKYTISETERVKAANAVAINLLQNQIHE